MDASVIICTYNRCESLRRTLRNFCAARVPDNLTWELLVIDNNSSDDTQAVCRDFEAVLPLRYRFEGRQGKSHALNHSLQEAKGDLLLFTDDDVDVDADWMAKHCEVANRARGINYFGGKVIPRWEKPPPRWLEENSRTLLRPVTVTFDLGESECLLTDPFVPFVGANLAFRNGFLQRAGLGFRSDLGLSGNDPVRGEEAYLIQQLMERNSFGLYVPGAVVHHRNPVDRMTERYVRQWYKGHGMADVRLGLVDRTTKNWLGGVPRWWWRKMLASLIAYGLTRFTRPSPVWLRHERIMATRWGNICELRAQAKRRPR